MKRRDFMFYGSLSGLVLTAAGVELEQTSARGVTPIAVEPDSNLNLQPVQSTVADAQFSECCPTCGHSHNTDSVCL